MADSPGISSMVVVAALTTAAGIMPFLLGAAMPVTPTGSLYGLGWPAFGFAGALLLDRDPRSRLGLTFAALAAFPLGVFLTAAVPGGWPGLWVRLEGDWERLGTAPVLIALAVIAWSVDRAADRVSRRRLIWLVGWSAALLVAVLLTNTQSSHRTAAVVTTLGLWALAGLVHRLATLQELRPVDEPLVDIAVALSTVAVGACVGLTVRHGVLSAGVTGAADLSGAFAAVVSAVVAVQSGLWLRRLFLERRYGKGTLSADDVTQITADLHTQIDARELLGKAAMMVATASGQRKVGLVLGPEEPRLPAHWVLYRLLIGGDRVGSMFLQPRHPEGPEARQERVVQQLLPTVALVAKAVSLAVRADHVRQDVARERDAERTRILGDLHDGIGPVLVGMSLRVRAELRRQPTPLLEALAVELADCRGDLRRIVSRLTPSALYDGDLDTALRRLIGSFHGEGPRIALATTGLADSVAPEVAVAVYRTVAEAVTNALRHARAQHISVDVRTSAGRVVVDVGDDGVGIGVGGGPITPGVGLSSLQRRADELGGSLSLVSDRANGTRLRLDLPAGTVTA